jgi:hypothetical protein
MRWTIAIFIVAIALIIDAMNFIGYYRDEVIVLVVRGINFPSDLAHR